MHISQMMRAGVRKVEEPAVVTRGVGAGGETIAVGMGKAGGTFEERVRMGGADAGGRAKVAERGLRDVHPLLRPQCATGLSGGAVGEKGGQVGRLVEGEKEKEKKVGLRKRLSRFWGRGRGKAMSVAVVAN